MAGPQTSVAIQALWALSATLIGASASAAGPVSGYIVEALGATSATKAVQQVGGRVTHDLPIIDGVAAKLTAAQAARLRPPT